jgi:hypothetical protein
MLPVVQGVAVERAELGQKEPAGQAVGLERPVVGQNEFLAQGWQTFTPEPTVAECFPAGQGVKVAVSGQKPPAGHGSTALDWAPQKKKVPLVLTHIAGTDDLGPHQ